MTTIAPYGSWESPIQAADTVAGIVRFSDIQFAEGSLFWIEGRPSEGGRAALVRRAADGTIADVLPETENVRTMVHEYGGGAYRASHESVVFSEFADQRLYKTDADADILALTGEPPAERSVRYADVAVGPNETLICVRETHPFEGEAVNDLVSIAADGAITVLVSGSDFYSSPRISHDGTQVAWIEWDHPNMPWDATRLVVADLSEPAEREVVAGVSGESVVQPEWAPDGTLVFVSDRSGWWNLYRFDDGATTPILTIDAEFAGPAWVFGMSWFGFLSDGRIAATYYVNGEHRLGVIDRNGNLEPVDLGFTSYGYHVTTDGNHRVWFVGARSNQPSALVEYDAAMGVVTIVRSNPAIVDEVYASDPQMISFPTSGGDTAHGVYYPPTNPEFAGPPDDHPPLLVHIHGGPTSSVSPAFALDTVFWTSRGFAIVDVNYRGSTGFGREYRKKLEGEWGVVDVDDAVAAAEYLASIGAVDGDRLAISGGSAGGYTTLAALAFRDRFAAGASYFGVADIEMLMRDSHKFESQYDTSLLGKDPEVWRARSPIHSVDQIDAPVALFQGLDDKVVPPNQAVVIADALASRGIPHVHIEYEGEGHRFRKAANVIRSLETELAFYGSVFGFTPAGDLPPLELGGAAAGEPADG